MPDLSMIHEALHGCCVPISTLKEDPDNARSHDKRSISAVRNSLSRFGQRTPIVVRNGIVIAGNARLAAARELGWTHMAVISADADDDNTALLYALADNRTAELSSWDEANLATALASLRDEDIDLTQIGWSPEELDEILDLDLAEPEKESAKVDDVPDVPETPYTKPGDLIKLGRHRLICGDSRDPDVVMAVVDDLEDVDLVVTDPPYGISYRVDEHSARSDGKVIPNDDLSQDDTRDLIERAFSNIPLRKGGSFYIFTPPGDNMPMFWKAANDVGWLVKQSLVWAKQAFVFGRSDYHYQHESILYGWVQGAAHYFIDDRTQGSVLEYRKPPRCSAHPTMKPVSLVEKLIRNSSRRSDVVFDPFLGSGTTLIAAERSGRTCCGVEFSPEYCDVIAARYKALTGDEPVYN